MNIMGWIVRRNEDVKAVCLDWDEARDQLFMEGLNWKDVPDIEPEERVFYFHDPDNLDSPLLSAARVIIAEVPG